MVGREREQHLLADAWEHAVSRSACHLFTVLGAAGIGKSRLAAEFLASLREATVVRGRCLPYGEGITYWPVLEVLKEFDDRQLDVGAAAALRSLLGESELGTSPEQIAWAFRKLLEAAAVQRALVCVFDDLHLGEETFLDLIEHVADLSREVPILLLCMARPELLDRRSGWGGGKVNATTVLLEPLDAAETGRLLDVLGNLGEALRDRILEASEGNPLFAEEMVALVREAGGGDVTVPPTIQALLAARLDQLEPPERGVLQCASVEGRVFHVGAVQALAPEEAQMDARLTALVRKELIRPERTQVAGEDAFRFRHLLIRDAAYDALAKATRADLHERFAAWLAEHAVELVELDEIVGYHLERAVTYRTELGPLDEANVALARSAATRLATAAGRAFLRRDPAAALSLISRAVSLLRPDDPARIDLLPNMRVMQGVSGDLRWVEAVVREALAAGDEGTRAHALVQQAFLRLFTASGANAEEFLLTGRRAVDVFARRGDELGQARAWRLIAQAHYLGRCAGASGEACDEALIHFRRVGGHAAEEAETLEALGIALLVGPTPATEAVGRCRRLLREIGGNPLQELMITVVLANLLALLGELTEAEETMDHGRRLRDERLESVWFFPLNFTLLPLLDQEPLRAEQELSWGYEQQRRMGEKSNFSTIAAMSARAQYAQGRFDESDRFSRESRQAAAPNDVHSQILWRTTSGLVLARRGELAAAEALVREAVAFAAESDFLVYHGDALLDLGEVLALAGRTDGSAAALEEAAALYERKGALLMVERAAARLVELREDPPTPA
jgi:tetratricopeptide (TPR) repeat protein